MATVDDRGPLSFAWGDGPGDIPADGRPKRGSGRTRPNAGAKAPVRLRPMDVLINVFVALHVIGIASLLGGFLTQMKAMGAGTARFSPAMLHGALTMLVTGVALVGLNQADDQTVNNLKIGIKLAILVVILGLVYVKRDEERVDKGLFAAVGGLTTANIFIATLWT
ncbi:putative integral membrane protein [Streptomyces venezuelae ATCC 10712]|uniref:Putative integral membrane protein n=2 Tax=Streptomyces TaxID=1883 RepID=F2RK25_STRVP|nr:putative integral membrane protein [Streptomyces venezuelae ATCC 10712]